MCHPLLTHDLVEAEHEVIQQLALLLVQPLLNGAVLSVDDSHIAWPSDIDYKFANNAPTNFNTDPPLRGGGTLNDTLKVSFKHFSGWRHAC